jgi:hypothetical protein
VTGRERTQITAGDNGNTAMTPAEAITGNVIDPAPRPVEVSDELYDQLEAAGWTPPGCCAGECR